jgi:hypothetical protein
LKNKILEYIKFVQVVIVKVIGFYWRWTLLLYVDLYEKKFMKSINHAFGACHLHVQTKVLHFVELSFWNMYSKLERQHSLVQGKKLRLKLLLTCKLFNFKKKILLIPISYLFILAFGFLYNGSHHEHCVLLRWFEILIWHLCINN